MTSRVESRALPGLVSVVIPFYSGFDWLAEAVDSVERQRCSVEIIVINDGSKEDDSNFLDNYGQRIVYVKKMNGGPASARNLGLELAQGEFIAFLDSDDIWLPGKLEKQIALMRQTQCVWSHTGYETFEGPTWAPRVLRRVRVGSFSGHIYPRMLLSSPLATPCIVIRSDFLTMNPGLRFREELRFGQDSDLWMRIAVGNPIVALDEALARVRIRGNNAGRRALVQLRARSATWELLREQRGTLPRRGLPWIGALGFRLAGLGSAVVEGIRPLVRHEAMLEASARIVYLIPWVLLKLASKSLEVRDAWAWVALRGNRS